MNFLAIGAHIGDAELMAGPLLVEALSHGDNATILALTPGELGNPVVPMTKYRTQKINENRMFCDAIRAKSIIFDDLRDGFLLPTEEIALRIARIIREERPEEIFTHWSGSFHPDHRRLAIESHEFAHGQTSGFRYIDYYSALMTTRGCLSNTLRAVGLMRDPSPLLL